MPITFLLVLRFTADLTNILCNQCQFFFYCGGFFQRKEKIATLVAEQDKKKADFKAGKMLGVSTALKLWACKSCIHAVT